MKRAVIYDILIAGGGPVGLSLAAWLGSNGYRVACFDRMAPASQGSLKFDGRTTAIAHTARLFLEQAGVWTHLGKLACPIGDIRVADQNSPLALTFPRSDADHPFGWIVENHLFRQALWRRLGALRNVDFRAPAEIAGLQADHAGIDITLRDGSSLRGALLVAADGRHSTCRRLAGIDVTQTDYWQSAIVCTLAHEKDHGNVAVENFQPAGPFAILPMTKKRVSIVWTVHHDTAQELMEMGEKEFIAQITPYIAPMLGKVRLAAPRFRYPLGVMHADSYTAPRLALVGDAAHVIHPIAGQGFNLGMRDIAALADILHDGRGLGLDLGSTHILQRYERRRRLDNHVMIAATDLLDRLFSNAVPGVGILRRAGIAAVDRLPPARKFFSRAAMGLHAAPAAKKKAATSARRA